jgi:hypothetical protein
MIDHPKRHTVIETLLAGRPKLKQNGSGSALDKEKWLKIRK